MRALPLLRILMRLSITVLLVLGILFWTGYGLALVPLHMAFGLIFVLGLWVLAGLGLGRGMPAGVATAAFVLGLLVLGLGMIQTRLLPGDYHWLVRVVHLALGLGAMGFAEKIAKQLAAAAGGAAAT
jgi:hypothetical protein